MESEAYHIGEGLGFVCSPMIWAFLLALPVYFISGIFLIKKHPAWYKNEERKFFVLLVVWLICMVPMLIRLFIHGSIL